MITKDIGVKNLEKTATEIIEKKVLEKELSMIQAQNEELQEISQELRRWKKFAEKKIIWLEAEIKEYQGFRSWSHGVSTEFKKVYEEGWFWKTVIFRDLYNRLEKEVPEKFSDYTPEQKKA